MKTYTADELKAVLALHLKWVLAEKDGVKANLRGANLSWADLSNGVDIISVSGIGSARRMTTYLAQEDKVWCGCFTGTLTEFAAKVEETHASNPKHLANYRAAIALFKAAKDER